MMKLNKLQQQFQQAILGQENSFLDEIIEMGSPSAKERIAIYQEGYKARLMEVLISSYPMLNKYLGHHDFALACNEYLDTHPSSFHSIANFGNVLSNFLTTFVRFTKKPYIAELACFEWALEQAFSAIEYPCKTIEDLRLIPVNSWPLLTFTFQPAVRVEVFNYNTLKLWQALNSEHTCKPYPLKNSQSVVFWRNNLTPYYRKSNHLEAKALKLMLQKMDFATVCFELNQYLAENDTISLVAELIMKWLRDGFIYEISINQ